MHIGFLSVFCNDHVMLGALQTLFPGLQVGPQTACTRCLQYDEEAGHEAFADDFQNAMTYFTKLSLTGGSVPLKEAYPWTKARCIMDVGGGRGELLSRCLSYGSQDVRGVLMDRPWVLDRCHPPCLTPDFMACYWVRFGRLPMTTPVQREQADSFLQLVYFKPGQGC